MSSAEVRSRPGSPRQRAYSVARFGALGLACLMLIGPLIWMVLSSFKSNADIYDTERILSFTPTIENYITVFGVADYGRSLFNSVWVSGWSTILSLAIGLPAAYAMTRYTMRKSSTMVLVARIIPGIALVVPWYYLFARAGLVGGFPVQIVAQMFVLLPLCVYIMMAFFESLPPDLIEAALVDGSSHIGAFLRIVLPLSVPGIATSAILSFIFAWNNFLFPLVLSNARTKVLPVAIFDFVSYANVNWGGIMAAATAMTLPILILAFFAQKYIVSGLTAGATKG